MERAGQSVTVGAWFFNERQILRGDMMTYAAGHGVNISDIGGAILELAIAEPTSLYHGILRTWCTWQQQQTPRQRR